MPGPQTLGGFSFASTASTDWVQVHPTSAPPIGQMNTQDEQTISHPGLPPGQYTAEMLINMGLNPAHYGLNSPPETSAARLEKRHKTAPLLEVLPVRLKRRVNMPAFRLEFDNLQDIQRRLLKCLVYIGGGLYLVSEIYEEETPRNYILYVYDAKGSKSRIPFNSNEINLRIPEPRYLQYRGQTAFYYRPPSREQAQGLSRSNSYIKYVHEDEINRAEPSELLKGFVRTDPMTWNETYSKLMVEEGIFPSIRLSNNIAFGMGCLGGKEGQEVLGAEYKGRTLGLVNDNVITVDVSDYDKPWIRRDVAQIGCKLRPEK